MISRAEHHAAPSLTPVKSGVRWIVAALSLPLVGLVIGFLTFAWNVASYKQPANIATADAIVVLTGGHARLGPAVALLDNSKGERLLISGVHPNTSKEAIRNATGGASSLFECCVDLDHVALDTIGNAAQSAAWMTANGYRSVIVVTSNYHMPRAMLEMKRYAPDVEARAFAIVPEARGVFGWLTDLSATEVLAMEYGKYLASRLRLI